MTAPATRPPQTVRAWVQAYRQRRRTELGSEERFRLHVRRLFRMSGYVKSKGWKPADLDAALDAGQGEPDAAAPATADGHGDRRDTGGACARAPGPGRTCIDCGNVLPADRRRAGRCERCRHERAKETAKERMRRRRTKKASQHDAEHSAERRSGARESPQSDDLGAGVLSASVA